MGSTSTLAAEAMATILSACLRLEGERDGKHGSARGRDRERGEGGGTRAHGDLETLVGKDEGGVGGRELRGGHLCSRGRERERERGRGREGRRRGGRRRARGKSQRANDPSLAPCVGLEPVQGTPAALLQPPERVHAPSRRPQRPLAPRRRKTPSPGGPQLVDRSWLDGSAACQGQCCEGLGASRDSVAYCAQGDGVFKLESAECLETKPACRTASKGGVGALAATT